MKTEQILQLVEAVSGFGLDEFEYEEDGVKLKLKKGGNVCTSVSAETAGRTKTEAEIARTEENAEVLLEGKIVKAPLVGIFYASPEEGGTPFVQAGDKVEKGTVLNFFPFLPTDNHRIYHHSRIYFHIIKRISYFPFFLWGKLIFIYKNE